MARIDRAVSRKLFAALDNFRIELPSWGFADSGTRFGKFIQPSAAETIEEKIADAAMCHRLTGACPSLAVHYSWDFRPEQDPREVARLARRQGIRIGAINPTLFQDEQYKYGSLASPDGKARAAALAQMIDCIRIAKAVGSKLLSLWFADGTSYPGQDDLVRRKHAMADGLRKLHAAMPRDMMMLVEYKPFEPTFYHTDIADWGMSYVLCRQAGPRARVLVDTGHHLPGCNIEHIVAFLLDEGMLGGFHFNDRKYADDDLTLGSIDPYAMFRIFNVIAQHEYATGRRAAIAYMIDQSHNEKPKIEAMLQTVDRTQTLFLKAQLVDRRALAAAQKKQDIVAAEQCLVDAYETDVRPVLAAWRRSHGLPVDAIAALRKSGYVEKSTGERQWRHGGEDDIPF
ncbi:MAG: TIM barrel protein [Phycisphaerae bacterium]